MSETNLRVLISEEKIQARIRQLGELIPIAGIEVQPVTLERAG